MPVVPGSEGARVDHGVPHPIHQGCGRTPGQGRAACGAQERTGKIITRAECTWESKTGGSMAAKTDCCPRKKYAMKVDWSRFLSDFESFCDSIYINLSSPRS